MGVRIGAWAASVGLALLVACGGPGGSETLPAGYERLDAPPTAAREANPIDLDRLTALLPDGFALNWEAAEQSGDHTQLTGVALKPDAAGALAFTAERVDIYGLDLATLEGMAAGDWVSAQTRLVGQIEARSLSVSGLETLYAPVLDEMNEAMAPLRELDPDMPDPSVSLDEYAFTVDRFVMAGLDVFPLEKAVEGDPGFREDPDDQQVQHAAALVRAFALEAAAFTGLRATMAMTQYDQTSQMAFSAGFIGYRGFARGDLASADVNDLSFDMAMQIPPEALGPDATATEPITLNMTGKADSYRVSELGLAGLLDAAAHGTPPPSSQTDLMSLGLWEVDVLSYTLDDQPLMSMDRASVDARGFHWLFPADLSFEIDGFLYDIAAYVPLITAAAPEELAGHEETVRDVVAALKRHDLTGPLADISGAWNWSPQSGTAALDFSQLTHGHAALSFEADGRLPQWDALAPHLDFSDGEPSAEDSAAIEAAFRADSALMAMEIKLSDRGGLDKLFNGAVDVAKALPQDIPQVKAFATYTPEQLRTMLSGMMLMGIGQAAKEVPQAREIGDILVEYVQEGGTIRFALAPDEPLTVARFEGYAARYPDPTPEQVIEFLGFTAEHIEP